MANLSSSLIVGFRGTKREVASTQTYVGTSSSQEPDEDRSFLSHKVFARLRALDQRALNYLAADLAEPTPVPSDDPLVKLVTGPANEVAIPSADRHAAFLVQQHVLRQDLRRQSISAEQAAKLLGVSRQTVHNQVRRNKLLAFRDGERLRLPSWQFDASSITGVVDGLPEVLAALRAAPLAQTRWFSLPQPMLDGRTPSDALRAGAMEAVVRAAARVGLR